jgi:hypothetical protein
MPTKINALAVMDRRILAPNSATHAGRHLILRDEAQATTRKVI